MILFVFFQEVVEELVRLRLEQFDRFTCTVLIQHLVGINEFGSN